MHTFSTAGSESPSHVFKTSDAHSFETCNIIRHHKIVILFDRHAVVYK